MKKEKHILVDLQYSGSLHGMPVVTVHVTTDSGAEKTATVEGENLAQAIIEAILKVTDHEDWKDRLEGVSLIHRVKREPWSAMSVSGMVDVFFMGLHANRLAEDPIFTLGQALLWIVNHYDSLGSYEIDDVSLPVLSGQVSQ